jgi:hypothetical protein
VLGGAVDAGVMHAGKHEHLVVVLPADHTGLLLLRILHVHLSNYNSLNSAAFIFLFEKTGSERERGSNAR